MSKEIFSKNTDIRLLYYRYKDTSYYTIFIISLVFFVCFILFFQVVLPQLQNWFSIRNEVLATRTRIDVINQNISFMNNLDKAQLSNQVTLTTSALPFEKDFTGILNALTDASLKAGVSLDDYSFQIGNIASISGQTRQSRQLRNATRGTSTVRVTISIGGSVTGVNNFLKEINKKLPLSEVIEVEGEFNQTSVTMEFYQKQFPQIVFQDDQPLVPLSGRQQSRLAEFESWLPEVTSQEPQIISSESAIPLF